MTFSGQQALVLGAGMSAAAALAHLVCIVIGAPAYRVMGAGERMARAAEMGSAMPAITTMFISLILLAWAAYALSGAGLIQQLPLTRYALYAITGVYLVRAFAFPFMKTAFPGNSDTFWWVSSAICGVIGLVHLYGVMRS